MPPCASVLLNKIKRTLNITRMIKSCNKNTIDLPKAIEGYCLNENNEYTIEYFAGYPYPENLTDLINDNIPNNNNDAANSDEDNCELSSSDEEYDEDFEDDEWKSRERFSHQK